MSVFLKTGTQVDLRVVKKDEFGAALIYFTGSKQHNIELRNLAIEQGWKLNEYGLIDAKTREGHRGQDRGGGLREARAAVHPAGAAGRRGGRSRRRRREAPGPRRGRRPEGRPADAQHLERRQARSWRRWRGSRRRAGTSTSRSPTTLSRWGSRTGSSEERFKKQWKAIDELNEKLKPFRILKGVEAEVRSDGSLDFDRSFFDQFDIVGASIHQAYRQSPEKLTERAVKALDAPLGGHPVPPHQQDHREERGEPARPAEGDQDSEGQRQDARDRRRPPTGSTSTSVWAKRAMQEGVKLVVDSDAHSHGGAQERPVRDRGGEEGLARVEGRREHAPAP